PAAFTGVINGFAPGDTIELAGVGFVSGGNATLLAGNMLQVVDGGNTYNIQLDPSQELTGDSFQLAGDSSGNTDITLGAGSGSTIADTAAHIAAELDTLEAQFTAGTLTSIILTDAGTPTMPITASQLTADAGALSIITGPYNLAISGVAAADAAGVAGQ